MDEGAEQRPGGTPPAAPGERPYEPPTVQVLGDLAELTSGTGTSLTDGVMPGSIAP